jgi:hypothetical protein
VATLENPDHDALIVGAGWPRSTRSPMTSTSVAAPSEPPGHCCSPTPAPGRTLYYINYQGDASVLRPSTHAEMWFESRFFPLSNYRYSSQPLRPAFEEAINDRDRSPAHTSAQGS